MRKPPPPLTPAQKAAVQEEVNSFRRDMRSTPPAPALMHQQGMVVERISRDTHPSGSWHVEELVRQAQAVAEQLAAAKVAEEIERRKAAEARLKELLDERRKWWLDLAKTVVAAMLVAALLFTVKQLAR